MIRLLAPAVLAAVLAAAPASMAQPADLPAGAEPIALQGQELVVRSAILRRDMRVRIHLPLSGKTERSPLAIVFVSRTQGDRIAADLREAQLTQANYGVVLVTVEEAEPLSDEAWEARFKASYGFDGAEARQFERFVAEELVPFLKARFPGDNKLVIGGIGLRGQFVLRLAASRPDLADGFLVRHPELPEGAAAAMLRDKAKPSGSGHPNVEILYDRESLEAAGELDALLAWVGEEGYLGANPADDSSEETSAGSLADAIAGQAMVPPT